MKGNYFTPFSLRLPVNLIETLSKIAKSNNRSMNKEMEFVLSRYVHQYEQVNGILSIRI